MAAPKRWILSLVFTVLCFKKSLLRLIIHSWKRVQINPFLIFFLTSLFLMLHSAVDCIVSPRLSNRRGWVGRGSWVVGRGSWVVGRGSEVTINWFPMYINFQRQKQFWFKNVHSVSAMTCVSACVSAMTKAATARLLANTCISATFNQSYLSIPTLPNEQRHGRYKADAWRLILSFHEINKSWPNMKTKIPWDV